MAIVGIREALYLKSHFNEVKHVTLDPNGRGVLRIHMVPPRRRHNKNIPAAVIVNGQDIIPLNLSWAILLSAFIDAISPFDGRELPEDGLPPVIGATLKSVRRVYPAVSEATFRDDLWTIISTLTDISRGIRPTANIGQLSIGEYAPHMTAPHRMDLSISSMTKEGVWNCNQQCLHCYASGQSLASVQELPAHSWKTIIDKCRRAGIPQLTFTGGEPTLRADLAELVEHAKWFVTRLNTNGVLLTGELCAALYKASLDSVQITLYDADPDRHNLLVGAENWALTVAGIENALKAGLNVSINTPLCAVNMGYVETLKLARRLGVRYASCSGLIPAGGARGAESVRTRLSSDELSGILTDACCYCAENGMDLSFTSPGWISEERLREIGIVTVPSCGACLSNMAVAPDGSVVPCQSWLSGKALGNMLTDTWKNIWNSPGCRTIRRQSAKMEQRCPLRSETEAKP